MDTKYTPQYLINMQNYWDILFIFLVFYVWNPVYTFEHLSWGWLYFKSCVWLLATTNLPSFWDTSMGSQKVERSPHWICHSYDLPVCALIAPRCACSWVTDSCPSCHCVLWSEGLNLSQISWHCANFPLCFISSPSSSCMSLWYNSKLLRARIQWTQPKQETGFLIVY